jgi:hypothetical protein
MIKLVRPCHLFIEVPVPHQKSVPSCIYVLRVSNSPLSTIFLFDLGTVPRLWYVLFILCAAIRVFHK